MIQIMFPDGSSKSFNKGVSAFDVAMSISSGLAKKAIAAVFNKQYIELSRTLVEDGSIEILTEKDPRILNVVNHSTAHLMAQAIKRLYPKACFGVGPAIDEGFYYDVDFGDDKVTDEDLSKIEKVMLDLASEDFSIVRKEVSYEEAKDLFKDDPYKLELIEEFKNDGLTVYSQGEFTD
ncbi:MAG: TGS domain-containing protein, partial [Acholeplasmataceae bacterium]|nr:TGS domain-containing protein [Acholeplasmataceae bacterium]